jgi:hypothetical protein
MQDKVNKMQVERSAPLLKQHRTAIQAAMSVMQRMLAWRR